MRIPFLLIAAFLISGAALCKEPAEEKNEALVLAILSNNWTWEHSDGGNKGAEEIQFYKGGIAECRKAFSCSWEIISPQTVVLQNVNNDRNNGKVAYLVFDESLTHFIGFDFNGKTLIEGHRREWLDPNRPAPEPRDPGGK